MASSASASSNTSNVSNATSVKTLIDPSLKFVVANLKSLIPHPLSSDNYPIWSNQIIKLLKANGFENFLDPSSVTMHQMLDQEPENEDPNYARTKWLVTDQNLAVALCSAISPQILLFMVHLESTSEIWKALQIRFQSANCSKAIQLKNELHNISMKNLSMTQYLTEIKKLVDQIAYAEAKLDTEDIIHHILNGLPQSYNSFKTSIRTMQNPLTLDNLYALLISEEIHIQTDASKHPTMPNTQAAVEEEDVMDGPTTMAISNLAQV